MPKSLRLVAAVAAACVLSGACAPHNTRGVSAQHNIITADELAKANTGNLYDALAALRPQFLRSHGGTRMMLEQVGVQVYVGNERMEGVEYLRRIPVQQVKDVIFLEPQAANARFPGNNASGAIVVTLM